MRERAVWRRFPASPMRSVSSCSLAMCISSYCSGVRLMTPASMSFKMLRRPRRICLPSSSVMMPWRLSIAAWAMEPSISSRYIRWSTPMEALNALTA